MSKYIEADNVKENLSYIPWIDTKAVNECIDKMEAEDVAPVVHAHWIDCDEDDWGDVYECSACGEWFILETGTPESNGYSYCPNCGAKMDEEEQHEQ